MKGGQDSFEIKHSAQPVIYDVKEFVLRDKDSIPDGLENVMQQTTDPIVQLIYNAKVGDEPDEEEAKGPKKKGGKTIWKKFGVQMDDLMQELAEPLINMKGEEGRQIPANAESCALHFVRCIKPRPKPLTPEQKAIRLFVHSMTL